MSQASSGNPSWVPRVNVGPACHATHGVHTHPNVLPAIAGHPTAVLSAATSSHSQCQDWSNA